jgi:ppGpp synthetase/RelA/SpoT-type nucleotidyltranferase
MFTSDAIVAEAVARYDRERDRYLKLALRVADICRTSIVDANAIRAQVTSRTKTVRSFAAKLKRLARTSKRTFASVDDVFAQISDLAGVRVATYRPEDESRVTDAVKSFFAGPGGGAVDVDPKDKLEPAAGQFYRATHCQVCLPEPELIGNYENLKGASCEIQVCSMMAHVWNEIEHDIGYKPEGEGPSDAELGLLETLGHLARAGDAAITRLLAANVARMTAQTGDFTDVHDFVARLRPHFSGADLSVNAGTAFDAAVAEGLTSVEKIRETLGDSALDLESAVERVKAFNAYLAKDGRPELSLNPASADLLTISLLERSADAVSGSAGAAGARPTSPRLLELARAFQDYRDHSKDSLRAA